MDFTDTLNNFITNDNLDFEYYNKRVIITHNSIQGNVEGDLVGISSEGTITLNDIIWPKGLLVDTVKHVECDFHFKAIKEIQLKTAIKNDASIKDKIFEIIKFKVAQHLLVSTASKDNNLEPLLISNRKQYLNPKSNKNLKTKKEIIQNILNMKSLDISSIGNIKSKIDSWISINQKGGGQFRTDNKFDINDCINLINSYHKLWVKHIKTDIDPDMTIIDDDDKKEEKSYATYMQWDDWSINSNTTPIKSDSPKLDIYLKFEWPHVFHGPYYKSLNNSINKEWRCKKCNKKANATVVEWYKAPGDVIQTTCNICGSICDKSCGLQHGASLTGCDINSGGKCKECTHPTKDHAHIGWKSREITKDNGVTDNGRIKYYKSKRTVSTFEICHSCIKKAKENEIKKNNLKIKKLKAKRKEKRKKNILNPKPNRTSPQEQEPGMDFDDIIIKKPTGIRPKLKSKTYVSTTTVEDQSDLTSNSSKSSNSPLPVTVPVAQIPISVPRIIQIITLTDPMKTDTSVRSALCFIPPKDLWPKIQEIRSVHDPAYKRWMPHINIFFPFINEKYFADIAKYIEKNVIKRCNISSFKIKLKTFESFDRVKLNSKSKKIETMFLKPFGCHAQMQQIFWILKKDWIQCANKHGGSFSPHLTVGKFKTKDMKKYMEKFQVPWVNIEWKCKYIYLISRRDNDPFQIRYKLPLGKDTGISTETQMFALRGRGRGRGRGRYRGRGRGMYM